MAGKCITIFSSSPRKKGTSFSFSRTIAALAQEQGNTVEIIHIIDYLDGVKKLPDLHKNLAESDIIGLVTPLYVDTLPYPVIWFMENLAGDFKIELKGKTFFAVSQCGFPDVKLMHSLLECCRFFARYCEMSWVGGLAYGGGAIINGAHLEDLGKKGQKITAGFKIAVEDILEGRPIRPSAQELLTVRIPVLLYWPLAAYLNRSARQQAKKQGVKDLRARPYLDHSC